MYMYTYKEEKKYKHIGVSHITENNVNIYEWITYKEEKKCKHIWVSDITENNVNTCEWVIII